MRNATAFVRRGVAGAALVGIVGALALGGCNSGAPTFRASDVTGTTYGRDFALTGHDGKPHQLADFRGKVVVLFFGYTHCPDVCPATLAELAEVMRRLGDDAARRPGRSTRRPCRRAG